MKKLSILFIAISFYLFGAGNSLASNPEIENLDRHANWTKQYDEKKGSGETHSKMDSKSSRPMNPSAQTSITMKGNSEGADFDFIRETMTYDHSRDKDKSS